MRTNFAAIEDDIQAGLDSFMEKITSFSQKEARNLKEEIIRTVCVEYPHANVEKIKKLYAEIALKTFSDENLEFYQDKWKKLLL